MKVLFCVLALISLTSGRSAYEFSDGYLDILGDEPEKSFDCTGRSYGYYADIANDCQVFHICLPIPNEAGEIMEIAQYSFFCGNQTVFSQESLVCTHPWDAFPCEESEALFEISNSGFGLKMSEEVEQEIEFGRALDDETNNSHQNKISNDESHEKMELNDDNGDEMSKMDSREVIVDHKISDKMNTGLQNISSEKNITNHSRKENAESNSYLPEKDSKKKVANVLNRKMIDDASDEMSFNSNEDSSAELESELTHEANSDIQKMDSMGKNITKSTASSKKTEDMSKSDVSSGLIKVTMKNVSMDQTRESRKDVGRAHIVKTTTEIPDTNTDVADTKTGVAKTETKSSKGYLPY